MGNYSPAWLQKACKELDENIVRAHLHAQDTSGFALLGFHPDWILNGPDDLAASWARDLGGEEPLLNFLRYYYWRALLHQPFAFARKVAAQMLIFYARPCPAFSIRESMQLAPRSYLRSSDALQRTSMLPIVGALDFGRSYLARIDSLSRLGVRKIGEGAAVAAANVLLAQLYCLVCLGGILIALWLLFRHSCARDAVSAPLLTIFLCLPNLANTLGISVIHTMEVDRYAYVQFGAALLAELWILRCLLALSLTRMNRFTSWMSARSTSPGRRKWDC